MNCSPLNFDGISPWAPRTRLNFRGLSVVWLLVLCCHPGHLNQFNNNGTTFSCEPKLRCRIACTVFFQVFQRHLKGSIFLKLCLVRWTLWPSVIDLITMAAIGVSLLKRTYEGVNHLHVHSAVIPASIRWKLKPHKENIWKRRWLFFMYLPWLERIKVTLRD